VVMKMYSSREHGISYHGSMILILRDSMSIRRELECIPLSKTCEERSSFLKLDS
jgi:hypothetical protein